MKAGSHKLEEFINVLNKQIFIVVFNRLPWDTSYRLQIIECNLELSDDLE